MLMLSGAPAVVHYTKCPGKINSSQSWPGRYKENKSGHFQQQSLCTVGYQGGFIISYFI